MKRCGILWITFCLLLTTAAHAQVTSLSLFSDSGDFVGAGQNAFFTSADGTFSAQGTAGGTVVGVNFVGQPGVFWNLEFATCCTVPMGPGQYFGAQTWPTEPSFLPGMLVSGDGRSCSTVTGYFSVLQVSYNADGSVASFDAVFEQHCEGSTSALSGEIRFNAAAPILLSAPPHQIVQQNQNVTFTVSAIDSQFGHVVLTSNRPPDGATFIDNGDNTATFSWTPNGTESGTDFMFFEGTDSAGNHAFVSTAIAIIVTAPPNDNFENATVISSIPFTTTEDATNATVAFDDPFCVSRNQTVWFAFTPVQNMRLEANTVGSSYDTTLGVYTGSRGALNQIGCNDDSNGTLQSSVRFDAIAGTTYYFEVSSFANTAAGLVFNLIPAPVPLAITPSVTQFGSIEPPTGTATISGFVSCTKPAFVTLAGQLKQTRGNTPITGFFSVFVPCDGITPWSATIQTIPTLFRGRSAALFTPGKAVVSATASAIDFDNGETIQRDLAVTITLRAKN